MSEWRRLEKGEIVQAGDEYDACANAWHDDAKWIPVKESQIGVVAPDPRFVSHRQFRRRTNNE